MEQQSNPEISKKELDLTEGELNRIFFGSEEKAPSDPSAEPAVPTNSKKLQRIKKIDIPTVIAPVVSAQPAAPEPEKRPQGRPKIWTDEKKEQHKREMAVQAEQRRKEKSDRIRLSRISTQEPISEYQTDKLIDSAIKSKDEIQKFVGEKRNTLKDILAQKNPHPFLRGSAIECIHLYKLHHFDTFGKVITACDKCSARQEMTMDEWNSYLSKNRKKI